MPNNRMIYDPHVHAVPTSDNLDECVNWALQFLEEDGVEGMNILVIKNAMMGMGHDGLYLYLKLLYPDKFSVYGGLATGLPGIPQDAQSYVDQVRDMMAAGFDGVKMWINGSTKDSWGFELDDAVLDPMWSYLEQTQFPLLIHVGNTEHWPANSPAGQKKKRNTLTNEPTNEPLYSRMERVLARHPKMNITIPHLYFMCEQKDRMAALMDRYPSLKLDICPGTAMYYDMSQDLNFWRDFFVKYQDRILFGTDNFLQRSVPGVQAEQIRRYLETGDTWNCGLFGNNDWGFDITGIGPLSEEILRKIYKTNFMKVRGAKRSVNVENTIAFLEKELMQMERMDEKTAPSRSRKITRDVLARLKSGKWIYKAENIG